jgi:O-antigen/teichoic acid export membrane protein
MAAAYAASEVLAGLLKRFFARRVCPQWRISPRDLRAATLREVFSFGGKTMLGVVSRTILYQTNAMLVGRFLGVEAIAHFARCRSLVLLLDTFAQRVVAVFALRASEADARGDRPAVRECLYQAAEVSVLAVLPGVLALLILGDPILTMWMGREFTAAAVLAVMAIGHLPMLSQRGTIYVLMGLHKHGLWAATELVAALAAIGLSYVFIAPLGLGLLGAALAIVAPLTVVHWIIFPIYVSYLLDVPLMAMVRRALLRPVLAVLPTAGVFMLCAVAELSSETVRVLLAVGLGGGVYAAMVLWLIVTPEYRQVVSGVFRPKQGVAG